VIALSSAYAAPLKAMAVRTPNNACFRIAKTLSP
jgi:hypothetical protein